MSIVERFIEASRRGLGAIATRVTRGSVIEPGEEPFLRDAAKDAEFRRKMVDKLISANTPLKDIENFLGE